jgi:predicted alpha/beta-hydrolase family hydrolase
VIEVHDRGGDPVVSGFLHEPAEASGRAIALTHGAGGNANSAFLKALAEAFAAAGWIALRYDLPFRQARKSGPPYPAQAARDRDGVRRAAAYLKTHGAATVVLGGQSYGGRQTSMALAESPEIADALLALSYPLHPPGKPQQLRVDHFPELKAPCLFVQGTRDPFATPEELREALPRVAGRTQLELVEKAGHSLPPGSANKIVETLTQFLDSRE